MEKYYESEGPDDPCDERINHVLECPYCLGEIQAILAHRAGSTKSEVKAEAARLNGLKGGRPRKNKRD